VPVLVECYIDDDDAGLLSGLDISIGFTIKKLAT
jgi:hypothetical protein